jgi:hypothetical protein
LRKAVILVEIVFFGAFIYCLAKWITTRDGNWEPWAQATAVPAAFFLLVERFMAAHEKSLPTGNELATLRRSAEHDPLSVVLPKVISYARRHKLGKLEHWARLESGGWHGENGMKSDDIVPEYRTVTGTWFDVFGRRLDLSRQKAQYKEAELLEMDRLRQPVSELEALAKTSEFLAMRNESTIEMIKSLFDLTVDRLMFHPSVIDGILGRIRVELVSQLADIEHQD